MVRCADDSPDGFQPWGVCGYPGFAQQHPAWSTKYFRLEPIGQPAGVLLINGRIIRAGPQRQFAQGNGNIRLGGEEECL